MLLAGTLVLGSCAGSGLAGDSGDRQAELTPAIPRSSLYEPLAVGDSWTYKCRDIKGGGEKNGKPFTIEDKVLGITNVGPHKAYEFSLRIPQVPSKPLKVNTEIMLLSNDPNGNLWIYGYLVNGAIHKIHAARIVSNATPAKGAKFGYTGPNGKPVSRIFFGIEQSNPTPLGVFTVADYEESKNTHDYGYARGTGIVEEDHGPNFEVDCLIQAVTLR